MRWWFGLGVAVVPLWVAVVPLGGGLGWRLGRSSEVVGGRYSGLSSVRLKGGTWSEVLGGSCGSCDPFFHPFHSYAGAHKRPNGKTGNNCHPPPGCTGDQGQGR